MLNILHDTKTDNGRHNLYSFNQASWTRSNIESLLPNARPARAVVDQLSIEWSCFPVCISIAGADAGWLPSLPGQPPLISVLKFQFS